MGSARNRIPVEEPKLNRHPPKADLKRILM